VRIGEPAAFTCQFSDLAEEFLRSLVFDEPLLVGGETGVRPKSLRSSVIGHGLTGAIFLSVSLAFRSSLFFSHQLLNDMWHF